MRFPSPRFTVRSLGTLFLLVVAFASLRMALAQNQTQPPPPQPQPAATLDDDQILRHLNSVITWYRHTKSQIQSNGLPTDAVYQANTETFAADAVRFAFASAEAAAPLVPNETAQGTESSTRQNLLKSKADTAANDAQLESQIDDLNDKIAAASKKNKQTLTDQRNQLQGQLDLGNAMISALNQLTKSSSQKGQNAGGFAASVAQLKTSVPEVFDSKAKAAASATSQPSFSTSSGIIGKLKQLYSFSRSRSQIAALDYETEQLKTIVNSMRNPLRDSIRNTIQQGHTLSSTPNTTRQDFDALAGRFDQLAAVSIPLSQELTMLDQTQANLDDWSDSVKKESDALLKDVFIRIAIILGVLGVLFIVSDLWKRITFKYVADIRRRRQFLLIRRVVIGFLMGLVLILSFVSEFSALATFAGFITAGLAVGLQTILLSVAAYFLLIGRYGLRIGDRVSIAGVTGDVVDMGFVRFYLMELAGTGIDLQPTGRVVAFSNSVLFQATSPMFKQAPGTDYAWHEIAIALNPASDLGLVETKMLDVVNKVYETYQPALDQQKGNFERRFEIPFAPLKPKAQLQFTDTGLEAVVRYPVSLRHTVDADDQITRTLIDIISKDEALKTSVSGMPKLRAAIRG